MRLTVISKGVLGALVLLLGSALTGCGQAQSEPVVEIVTPVKIFEVPQQFQNQGFYFEAEVKAGEQAQLSFQVPGQIAELNVRMGQSVEKGQLLAKLDPRDYRIAVASRQAQFELHQSRLKRAEHLFSKQLISEDDYDQTKTDFTAARLNLEQAQTDLSYTELHAPFSGVVSYSYVKAHQFVGSKQPVMHVLNQAVFDLDFALPLSVTRQLDLDKLKQSELLVNLGSFPDLELKARFKEISTQPDPDTNSYNVTLSVERPTELNILPGMSGTVNIRDRDAKTVQLQLPSGAVVMRQDNTAKVWKIDAISQRLVGLEVELDQQGNVLKGLQPGDRIVAAGAKALQAGQVVRKWVKEGGI